MKKFLINILLLAIAGSCGSCAEDFKEDSKGFDELQISASEQEVVLLEENYARSALKLFWTTGNNYGTGAAIDYRLEIVPDGMEYGNGYSCDLGRRVYEQNFTVQELNGLLLGKLGATPSVAGRYHARVTASVAGASEVQYAQTDFTVTPYAPVSETLYLIGSATPNGWSADRATEMKRLRPGVFTWTGNLNPGEFKFITTLTQFTPSYGRDAQSDNEFALAYRPGDEDPDEKFIIEETGAYILTVDLLDLRLKLEATEEVLPPFSSIYFVSEANGWSFLPMRQDPVDPFVFRYGGEIGNGQFKFGTAENSWENMYKTDVENAEYTHTTAVFVNGFDPDNKWLLTAETPGLPYKIALDITPGEEKMTMTAFTPYESIWLVGDSTPSGWDIENATPMLVTNDPYTLTWSGTLKKGELKFTCDKDSSWSGAWFMACEENEPLKTGSNPATFVPRNGGVDRKWIVEEGNYTLLLNQLTETITVTRN